MQKQENVKCYLIPQDVLLDTLRMLITNRVPHKIIGVKELQNLAQLEVRYDKSERHGGVEGNLIDILDQYQAMMKGLMIEQTLFLCEEDQDFD